MDCFNAKAWIFDLDGTLVDNMGHHELAWVEFFRRKGHDVDLEYLKAYMSGKTATDVVRHILGQSLTEAQVAAYAAEKEVLYREMYKPHLAPLPGLVEFLDRGRTAGIRFMIGSAAIRANIDFVLEGLGLADAFDGIVCAGDISRSKPDPEVFLKAAALEGVDPRDCIVFEDAKAGLEAARRAGMRAVLLETGYDAHELREHPGASHIAKDYRELLVR